MVELKIENELEFDAAISNNDKLVIIFYNSWCPICRLMIADIMDNLEIDDSFNLAIINIDKAPDLKNKYNVTSVPTVFIYKNKELVDTLIGNYEYNEIKDFFN